MTDFRPDPELVASFAPGGRLRASINVGNPILARIDASTEKPAGVSVDLANELGRRLGVGVDLAVFDAAGKSVEAVEAGAADIGFFAIDPKRGVEIAFTAAYVHIEGCYLVRIESPITGNDEVDRDGTVVVVGKESAYDLFLTRKLRHARIERSPTSPTVVETFLRQNADVAAGVRQQLEADARKAGGLRLLDGRFMVIRQAMGLLRQRGPVAEAY